MIFSFGDQHGRECGWLCVIIAQNEGTEICDKNHKTHWFHWRLSPTEVAKLENYLYDNAIQSATARTSGGQVSRGSFAARAQGERRFACE